MTLSEKDAYGEYETRSVAHILFNKTRLKHCNLR